MPSFGGKMDLVDRLKNANAHKRTVKKGTALKCVSDESQVPRLP